MAKYNACDRCGEKIQRSKIPLIRVDRIKTYEIFGIYGFDFKETKNEFCNKCTKEFNSMFKKWMNKI